jgi:hypothetical protein
MGWLGIRLIFIVLLTSGCSLSARGPVSVVRKDAVTLGGTYRAAARSSGAEKESQTVVWGVDTGHVKPYVPVVLPPKVIKVWVPAHVSGGEREVMVGGHWAFVMLRPAEWFIDRQQGMDQEMSVIIPQVPDTAKEP